jgi:hypothetical protein
MSSPLLFLFGYPQQSAPSQSTCREEITATFELKGVHDGSYAEILRVNAERGDTLAAWKAMGSPRYPPAAG